MKKLVVLFILSFFCLSFAASNANLVWVSKLVDLSKVLINNNHFILADKILSALQDKFPNNTKILLLLAKTFMKLKQFDRAELILKTALKLGDKQAIFLLFELYEETHDWLSEKQLIKKIPVDSWQNFYYNGILQMRNSNLLQAAKLFEKALDLSEKSAKEKILFQLLQVYNKLGDKKNFKRVFDMLASNLPFKSGKYSFLLLFPQDWQAWLKVARQELKQGNFYKAKRLINIAKSLNPNSYDIKFLEGQMNYKLGQFEEFKTNILDAIDINPNFKEAFLFGINNGYWLNDDVFLEQLSTRAKDAGLEKIAALAISAAYLIRKKYSQADKKIGLALNIPLKHLIQGRIYFAKGSLSEALSEFKQAGIIAYPWIALIKLHTGNLEEASKLLADSFDITNNDWLFAFKQFLNNFSDSYKAIFYKILNLKQEFDNQITKFSEKFYEALSMIEKGNLKEFNNILFSIDDEREFFLLKLAYEIYFNPMHVEQFLAKIKSEWKANVYYWFLLSLYHEKQLQLEKVKIDLELAKFFLENFEDKNLKEKIKYFSAIFNCYFKPNTNIDYKKLMYENYFISKIIRYYYYKFNQDERQAGGILELIKDKQDLLEVIPLVKHLKLDYQALNYIKLGNLEEAKKLVKQAWKIYPYFFDFEKQLKNFLK